jgi:hypothetical protein
LRLTPSLPLAMVGGPDDLRRRQRPKLIDDLRSHACLRMRRSLRASSGPGQPVRHRAATLATP